MSLPQLEQILSGGQVSIDPEELLPGTIHLVDMEDSLHVKKGKGSNADIILRPQPLDNVNDPLRWSQRKKNAQFSLLFVWSVFLAATVNWNGPYWTEWTEEFNCTYNDLNLTAAMCFLFLGLGCVFLQPTALKLGRRFVYLVCTLLALVSNIVGMKATNWKFMIAVNILSGFAAAPVDSLVEISSTDVFFTHERATKLAWLVMGLYFGSYIGPVVAGYLPNWQWAFKLQIIMFCVLFVVQLFLMEDTTFSRSEDHTDEDILQQIRSKEIVVLAVQSGQVSEKDARVQHVVSNPVSSDSDEKNVSGVKRTYWKRMQLLELEYNMKESWVYLWSRPILMAPLPAVIWGGVVYGAQMMWLSLMATTQSEIFGTYYGFSTSSTGLTNLAPLAGCFIGMVYGGQFVDWLSVYMAKRNNGILEAEYRLYAMVFPTLINAAGVLAYGLGANSKAPWAVPVIVGQGFLGFSMTSTGPICLTYAIECYPELSSEALVLMLFVRNMIGTGFTWGIQAWLDRDGLVLTTWLMFMLSIIINGFAIFFVIWGKKWRRMTKNYYLRICNK
ncbi:Major Facilitator Superfamily protein [Metschnikowia aff. pulcherrima]|uniref:Major Facilitator Superfamily protein n=1 Tax=Metschnikowia aff. pulcherrima TaxID=2163413 RepID=A0A4P6XX20_9ASCO|nr:Major Facilitator Superfamily protein [Metschnikowia aff. pulcherrima]